MSPRALTSLARLPLLLLRGSDEPGAAPAASGRFARSRDLDDPDGRVPLSLLSAVWRDVLTHDPDPTLGLRLGRRITVRSLGLVGYVLATSRTLGDALDRLSRYCAILRDGVECQLERSAGTTSVTFHDHAPVDFAARAQADARLAGLLRVCRRLTRERIVPRAVDFPYDRPARIGEHRKTFGTDRMRFARSHAGLTFCAADVARPVRSADDTLAGYLDLLAADLLRRAGMVAPQSFADEVARVLAGMLGAEPLTIHAVGSQLGVSSRTLQRRLHLEGTSFVAVLDLLRRREAEQLLGDRRLTVEAIAARLGYSEPSTLYRAFRRWRRTTPGAFRGRLPGTPATSP
jgi:AraC-like DNA-binding protein